MNKSLKIVFMGTPEFAVATLKKINHSPHSVVAVVTVPDKPAGRGKKIRHSAVKEYALENKLPLLQPIRMKDPDFVENLMGFKADLFVVVAFRMLPEIVWAMPALGTFNLHASLLPQYRGAAPINHAIINGENHSGVTTFFIDKKIDTGKIIMQKKVPISPDDNAGDLHDKLMEIGSDLVLETLEKIASGNIEEIPQEKLINAETPLKPAPKIFKEDCQINWSKSSREIHNLIRGLSPYPAAFTKIYSDDGKLLNLKIFKAHIHSRSKTNIKYAEIITDGVNYLRISSSDGILEIDQLQMEGKRKMNTKDFLNGFRKIKNYNLLMSPI